MGIGISQYTSPPSPPPAYSRHNINNNIINSILDKIYNKKYNIDSILILLSELNINILINIRYNILQYLTSSSQKNLKPNHFQRLTTILDFIHNRIFFLSSPRQETRDQNSFPISDSASRTTRETPQETPQETLQENQEFEENIYD